MVASSRDGNRKSWWREWLSSLAPLAGSAANSFRSVARETMEEAQRRVQETTRMVLKAVIVFVIIATGLLFILSGLARWLDARYACLPGTGAMLVGTTLLFLGLFAWAMRR